MAIVLVTGAFGNVGRSVMAALTEAGHRPRAFESPTRRNRALARSLCAGNGRELVWGDVRDTAGLTRAMEGASAVIHLAAIIPPAANAMPERARSVNVDGTASVLAAIEASPSRPRLVFSSSVATYGDRLEDFFIRTTDPLRPCPDDPYARHKVECEGMIRSRPLEWVICRLSYIVWRKKLSMDPLMFRMPLDTRIEVCHTEDTGRALARAAFTPEAAGGTYNIAGGPSCRTSYRAYLDRMLRAFGLGGIGALPEEAFSVAGYHCGFMDTDESQRLFGFQTKTLEDYYAEVEKEARSTRFWARAFRPLARAAVLAGSSWLRAYRTERGRSAVLHPARA